ncbi:hypothetical protein F511_44093 [Dorcoceras hygrometricum]|uniref:Uncharacterized protein n=1 Tax=Dorcoceras hygrometricum TaxID=472368 RepID=A0A2Z7CAQ9_9LAMI|nr:hypothetical protein F511_44093 [Dorcoceras hygrometricum]
MVLEYKKLSKSFEEVRAEKESYATNDELAGSSNMQAALSKLVTENEAQAQAALNQNRSDASKEQNRLSILCVRSLMFRSQQQLKLILFEERDCRSDKNSDKESKREIFVKEKDLGAYIYESRFEIRAEEEFRSEDRFQITCETRKANEIN